ncbi:MAG: ComEA family DNA-binding protein [Microbacteriaceae bacterium]
MDSGSPSDDLPGLAPSTRRRPRAARVRIGVGAVIVLLILALVVAVGVSMFAPHGSSSTIPAPVQAGTARAGTAAAGVDKAPAPTGAVRLFVHVLGAVPHPGIYELSDGSRVMDAVAAAGGFSANAEQSGVNLARKLTDGEQLVVPKVGEVLPGPVPGALGGAGSSSQAPVGKVNLNSADQATLETLPRVGPQLAKRIMDWRSANGRFASIEDLMSVTGIGDKTFDGLKDLVTV